MKFQDIDKADPGIELTVLEASDAQKFAESVNEFTKKHNVKEVTTSSTSFSMTSTKFIAHIWHAKVNPSFA